VKGRGARVTESGAISVPECDEDQSRQGFSAFEMCSSRFAAFFTAFSLGRMIVITDNAHHKTSAFPAESVG
jgi:hypothetical protein